MASIWSRNKIWGGTFTTDVDVADGTNNASVVPTTSYLGLKLSTEVDPEGRNRSKWFTSVIGQLLRSVLHKDEDRATSDNLGVSGSEPTTTKYVTVEQLPVTSKTTNDFTGSAGDGALSATQNTINITTILTGTAKQFVASLHTDFVAWLLARTWTLSSLTNLVSGSNGTYAAVRLGTISFTADTTDDDTSRHLIIDTRTIGKGSSGANLSDDKYENLWKHLYDKYPDAICELNVTRTTRDADWIANRTLTLPKIYGKGISIKDGTTEYATIGQVGGTKTVTLTQANLPAETLVNGVPNFSLTVTPGLTEPNVHKLVPPATAFSILDPYCVLNAQIKY